MKKIVIYLGITVACQGMGLADSPTNQPASESYDLGVIVVKGHRIQTGEDEGSATNGYRYQHGDLGPLGNVPLKDVPYSVAVTSGELIENRNVHNPTDALKTIPTVVPLMSSSAGGAGGMSRVMIRGFNASDQSELRDGMVDRSWTLPPVEDIDRIEVLSGLSGFLYGFSAVGGSVNYVTKPPLNDPFAALSAGFYNKGILFGQADLGGPIGDDRLTSRLNLYGEDGQTYIDDGDQRRGLASAALRYQLLSDTYLTANCYLQRLDMNGPQAYFDISGIGYQVPSAFNPKKQYGQDWTYNSSAKGVFDVGLDSRLNDIFTLRAAYRRGEMWRDFTYVKAKLTDMSGNYTESSAVTPRSDESTDAAYALIDAEIPTWFIEHKVTAGYTRWDFLFNRGADVAKVMGPSSVSVPIAYPKPASAGEQDRYNKQYANNFLVGDCITLNSYLSLLAGANYAQYVMEAGGVPTTWGPYATRVTQEKLTPSVGLVFKPVRDVSTYASYMQGLESGGTAPTTAANADQVLDPSVSDQYEIGAKASVWDALDISLALFRIDKVNAYVDPGDNVYKQTGREIHQGVELLASGKIVRDLTLVGGWTLMSAELEKANKPEIEGEIPINVPEQQGRLYLEYALPKVPGIPGLFTVTGGANYYGRRPVSLPNTSFIPNVTTFDAGLRYQPTAKLAFNLNVSNMLDKYYWSYYNNGQGLILGDPRLCSFSAKYTF